MAKIQSIITTIIIAHLVFPLVIDKEIRNKIKLIIDIVKVPKKADK